MCLRVVKVWWAWDFCVIFENLFYFSEVFWGENGEIGAGG